MADDLAKFARDVLNMVAALSDQRMKGVMTDLGDAAKGDMLEAVRADLGAMRGFNLTAGEESWRGSGACVHGAGWGGCAPICRYQIVNEPVLNGSSGAQLSEIPSSSGRFVGRA